MGVILTAAFTWYDSVGVGEQFSPRIPVYAAIKATAVLALVTLLVNLFIAPWRLHQAQATCIEATIAELCRKTGVGVRVPASAPPVLP